jgi:hypothetical protein
MFKRNILQVVFLAVALSAFGQASAGTIVSSDTELGSSSNEEGNKSVLSNKSTNRALKGGMGMGKGKGKGKGGSKGSKGKGKGKVS